MSRRSQEKWIKITLVIATLVMTILRFLLNEKGRVSPDSIRFMRQANIFPVIDNTTAPLGYPLFLKFFTYFGLDEFWSSKLVGILSLLFIIIFAWKKKFYSKETVITASLFSFVSIFSYTISEALLLPFLFVFLYFCRQTIIDELSGTKAIAVLSLLLVLLLNVRYNAVFYSGALFLFGVLNWKKNYGKTFISVAVISFLYVLFYKFAFIDYFNKKYVDTFLEVGLKSFSTLSSELFFGLLTTFNPLIHMSKPGASVINYGIYGIGAFNLILMIAIFIRFKLSESEKFLVFCGVTGIFCSFFIQFFYSTDDLDYRLLTPFSFPIWLVYFKKLWQFVGKYTFTIGFASIATGLAFTILSKGNYLENRSKVHQFFASENLENKPIKFYNNNFQNPESVQLAELFSTVNSNLEFTAKASDTLKSNVLTSYKILKKIKIDTNKYQ